MNLSLWLGILKRIIFPLFLLHPEPKLDQQISFCGVNLNSSFIHWGCHSWGFWLLVGTSSLNAHLARTQALVSCFLPMSLPHPRASAPHPSSHPSNAHDPLRPCLFATGDHAHSGHMSAPPLTPMGSSFFVVSDLSVIPFVLLV